MAELTPSQVIAEPNKEDAEAPATTNGDAAANAEKPKVPREKPPIPDLGLSLSDKGYKVKQEYSDEVAACRRVRNVLCHPVTLKELSEPVISQLLEKCSTYNFKATQVSGQDWNPALGTLDMHFTCSDDATEAEKTLKKSPARFPTVYRMKKDDFVKNWNAIYSKVAGVPAVATNQRPVDRTLLITNLPPAANERTLKEHFPGPSVYNAQNDSGENTGRAYLEYPSISEMKADLADKKSKVVIEGVTLTLQELYLTGVKPMTKEQADIKVQHIVDLRHTLARDWAGIQLDEKENIIMTMAKEEGRLKVDAEYKESILGETPFNWEQKVKDQLAKKKNEISPTQAHFTILPVEELMQKKIAHAKKVAARIKKGGPAILNVPSLPKALQPKSGPGGRGGGQGPAGRGRGGGPGQTGRGGGGQILSKLQTMAQGRGGGGGPGRGGGRGRGQPAGLGRGKRPGPPMEGQAAKKPRGGFMGNTGGGRGGSFGGRGGGFSSRGGGRGGGRGTGGGPSSRGGMSGSFRGGMGSGFGSSGSFGGGFSSMSSFGGSSFGKSSGGSGFGGGGSLGGTGRGGRGRGRGTGSNWSKGSSFGSGMGIESRFGSTLDSGYGGGGSTGSSMYDSYGDNSGGGYGNQYSDQSYGGYGSSSNRFDSSGGDSHVPPLSAPPLPPALPPALKMEKSKAINLLVGLTNMLTQGDESVDTSAFKSDTPAVPARPTPSSYDSTTPYSSSTLDYSSSTTSAQPSQYGDYGNTTSDWYKDFSSTSNTTSSYGGYTGGYGS